MKVYVSEKLKEIYNDFVKDIEKCNDTVEIQDKLYDYSDNNLFNETMKDIKMGDQCQRLVYEVRHDQDQEAYYLYLHYEDKEEATVLLKEVKF